MENWELWNNSPNSCSFLTQEPNAAVETKSAVSFPFIHGTFADWPQKATRNLSVSNQERQKKKKTPQIPWFPKTLFSPTKRMQRPFWHFELWHTPFKRHSVPSWISKKKDLSWKSAVLYLTGLVAPQKLPPSLVTVNYLTLFFQKGRSLTRYLCFCFFLGFRFKVLRVRRRKLRSNLIQLGKTVSLAVGCHQLLLCSYLTLCIRPRLNLSQCPILRTTHRFLCFPLPTHSTLGK